MRNANRKQMSWAVTYMNVKFSIDNLAVCQVRFLSPRQVQPRHLLDTARGHHGVRRHAWRKVELEAGVELRQVVMPRWASGEVRCAIAASAIEHGQPICMSTTTSHLFTSRTRTMRSDEDRSIVGANCHGPSVEGRLPADAWRYV